MSQDQVIVFAVLGAALVLFGWGRWRYDLVAVTALLAIVVAGVVPTDRAFDGFAHPAVVMVAAVLILSRALQNAGVVDVLIRVISPLRGRENAQIAAQATVTAGMSGLMNNVGALALMLPVAVRNAYRDNYSPAKSLMPLAFASLLGGLVTLIGTPPNIIVSSFRATALGEPYAMFDFAPVGGAVALGGLAFVVLIGWRLIPKARRETPAGGQQLDIGAYLLEVKTKTESKAVGMALTALERLGGGDVRVLGLARDDRQMRPLPFMDEIVGRENILLLQGEPDALTAFLDRAGLEPIDAEKLTAEVAKSDAVDIVEAVVRPGSIMAGRTPASMRLRTIHGINVLGIARHGQKTQARLRDVRIQHGDVLMLQGQKDTLEKALGDLGCLPLVERNLGIGKPRRLAVAATAFVGAIAAAGVGLVPLHVAFLVAVAAVIVLNIVRLDEAYGAVDWPVIVLLGAMIPVGTAVESTGGATLIADTIARLGSGLSPALVLTVLFVGTMTLSDAINNNATAVIMAPIALELADRLDANPDAFLMAVAIAASCAFLTPIGHQSNTLVLAPGGYKFSDYWRMGLPLEILITAIAVPMLLIVWPL